MTLRALGSAIVVLSLVALPASADLSGPAKPGLWSGSASQSQPAKVAAPKADELPVQAGPLNTLVDTGALAKHARTASGLMGAHTTRPESDRVGLRTSGSGRILGATRPGGPITPPLPTVASDPAPAFGTSPSGTGPTMPVSDPQVSSPIPAPGAGLLGAMGLSLVGWLRRRAL